jgi:hypothetical protein
MNEIDIASGQLGQAATHRGRRSDQSDAGVGQRLAVKCQLFCCPWMELPDLHVVAAAGEMDRKLDDHRPDPGVQVEARRGHLGDSHPARLQRAARPGLCAALLICSRRGLMVFDTYIDTMLGYPPNAEDL